MTRAYVVTLRDSRTVRAEVAAEVAAEEVGGVLNWYVVSVDGRATPREGTLHATPLVPLARELARLDLDAVSVAEETHERATWLAAYEERMAYRCHACGAPDNGAPLRPEEQHLVDEMLREVTT